MKQIPHTSKVIPALVFAISGLFLQPISAKPIAQIELANRHAETLRGSVAVVPVEKLKLSPDSAVAVVCGDKALPAQLEDLDGDGVAENLVFLVDMRPGETAKFTLESRTEPFPSRVAASVLPAWESEMFGFRSYGPLLVDLFARQGGNYGLRLSTFFNKDNQPVGDYHKPGPLGMDILHINKTLGLAGVFASDGKTVAIPTDVPMTSRILANGPVRAVVEMKLGPWKSPWGDLTFTRRASIAAGQFGTRLEDSVSPPDKANLGVGLRKEKDLIRMDDPATATFMHRFHQDEFIGDAGIGLLLPGPKPLELPEDDDNRYFSAQANTPLRSVAFAFWSGEENAPIDKIAAARAQAVRSEQLAPDTVSINP
ncbi:MAG: DUF4861 family protein [Verrucomicrobiae bacterium]